MSKKLKETAVPKKIKVFTKKKNRKAEPEEKQIEKLQENYKNIDSSSIKQFSDFPFSTSTQKGLKDFGFVKPTEIQRECIGLGLQGYDILGAAHTGSGKTLAFIIPILEKLYTLRWTRLDGLGALVITPTRELAYQIFEALRKVGIHHDFSAGLIIGGKDLKFERNRMGQCNIVICTPGRLLQHMDENSLFDCVNLKILVLDEADRCLDMGFEKTMNAIIANLPFERQTLLFSATQTKSVKDLARLSLKDPKYVSVHEHAKYSTPLGLEQSYMICDLDQKVSVLWSFIKNHLKKKTIVFLSTCKQVKFFNEMFCKLRPGVSLLALYGTLHQLKRMEIYETFCKKQAAVLFATDLVSRGLDFPEVHWVVQVDCPEDSDTYIHRVGRTARYHKDGESLLLLLPSEIKMLEELESKKIPIKKIEVNPEKLKNPVRKMEAFLASTPSLKDTSQRAFVSYVKSVFLMKNKNIFDVDKLDTVEYAKSLGLSIAPRVRFIDKMKKNEKSNKIIKFNDENESSDYENELENETKSEYDKKDFSNFYNNNDDDDDELDLFNVTNRDKEIAPLKPEELSQLEFLKNSKSKKIITKIAAAKKVLKKNFVANKKVVFDDEGEIVPQTTKEKQSEIARNYEKTQPEVSGIDIETAKIVLKEEDRFDKQLFKDKVKAKKKEQKKKLKLKRKRGDDEEEVDDFDESDGYEPDLSWLPDPDKIYGKENAEKDVENDKDEEKQKIRKTKKEKVKKKKQKLSEDLTVNEAEELAMLLLNKK
nr:probable ATP-dependent RNA helicase DDX10 [Onthophagus taurus]